jgi:hypothetical protein
MNPNQAASTGGGLVTSFLSWLKQPFQSGGSALNWLGFVGLLIIAAWFWNHVLLTIQNDI